MAKISDQNLQIVAVILCLHTYVLYLGLGQAAFKGLLLSYIAYKSVCSDHHEQEHLASVLE